MKLTLLEYVQNIASALNSDQVNSIGDSTESQQIATIVKTAYFNIIARANLPEQRSLKQLDASVDLSQPNVMYVPEGVKSIEWLKYYDADDDALMYKYVTLVPLQQFADYVNGFDTSQTYVDTLSLTIDSETYLFRYRNDIQPCYATVLSDYYVIFDSYNSDLDSTLQSSKTEMMSLLEPIWNTTDDFYPSLDDGQVPLLLNEAKSLAFFEMKQSAHPKAEQEAKRQWTSLQRDKSVDNKPSYFDALPDFGRRGRQYKGLNIKW